MIRIVGATGGADRATALELGQQVGAIIRPATDATALLEHGAPGFPGLGGSGSAVHAETLHRLDSVQRAFEHRSQVTLAFERAPD